MKLTIDPVACAGHGVCAELLPEQIGLDEWGYPVLRQAEVPSHLRKHAKRAAAHCPALAVLLEEGPARR